MIRLIEPGWDEDVTAAIIGPFADSDAVADALERSGRKRSDPKEDPLTAFWKPDGVEVLPLSKEMPPR